MSVHYATKEWNLKDAQRALLVEQEFNKSQQTQMLVLKFPDPELSKDIIKQFSPHIENVQFQQPSTPRYCIVQIKSGTDLNKVKEELSEVPFGVGKLSVEFKNRVQQSHDVSPEDIDPYTLYIGNLPTNINVNELKSHFTKGRVDLGYAQPMKFTRYALLRLENIEDSIAAFKVASEIEFDSRSLVVRFRRKRGNIGINTDQVNIQQLKKVLADIKASSQDSKATAEYELSSETTRIKTNVPNLATASTRVIRPIELTEIIKPETCTVSTQTQPQKEPQAAQPQAAQPQAQTQSTPPLTTRSGRQVKKPHRYR